MAAERQRPAVHTDCEVQIVDRLDVGGEPRSLVPRFCSNEIGAGVDRHLWQSEAEMHRLTRGGLEDIGQPDRADRDMHLQPLHAHAGRQGENRTRSEEHTSEIKSLMSNSYAV